MKKNHGNKGQRGFTLIELLAVMAIMAVLVGVVAPAVTGTRDASVDAQVLQDATQVRSAASDYYGDKDEAEVRTPHTITTTSLLQSPLGQVSTVDATVTTGVGETTAAVTLTHHLLFDSTESVFPIYSTNAYDHPSASSYNAVTQELTVAGLVAGTTRTFCIIYESKRLPVAVTAQQITSNRWPERFISLQVAVGLGPDGTAGTQDDTPAAPAHVVTVGSGYAQVIPTSPADNIYVSTLVDKKYHGIDGNTLLTRYTAIDIKALVDGGYLQKAPAGSELASDGIPNFLWLFEKTSSAGDRSDDNREVAVFRLVNVEQVEGDPATTELVNATDGTVSSQNATHADKVKVFYERIL